mmetsp:Transcript_25467/g.59289  ORF Transcript_25467/g.59289 Transcript_25467/m.59289 type:complete len:199 (-) Transcript_25467:223-819(-)|eukprot:CAMPEP_0178425128 /NCGR_PEP_ID=MMETSP0689_2-20121128/28563_1 /TAXON_ID=160604 /ORGANISM="Amphidinium massartii, Strain CS-259" /LENGTH=198 /DNA_ID=CAMNT_0020046781 /DNA_START=73 /DNA_END=669 /DNA_ORIENTATION=-
MDPESAALTRGAVRQVLGKKQESEKSRLASHEKRFGVTWFDLHAYKDRMTYPGLPTMMASEELPKEISLCDADYRGLDRCLTQGRLHEVPSQPYARMQICKPHWIRFVKCVNRRDDLVLRAIKKWEHDYCSALDDASRQEYFDDLDTKKRYFLYAASHTSDAGKRSRLEANAQHCAIRQASLLRHEDEMSSNGAGVPA